MGDEAERLLRRRFAIIQCGADQKAGPGESARHPGCAQPRAGGPAGRRAALPAPRRPDYRLKYNPGHAGSTSRDAADEALVFKVYDSETDGGRGFTPHTSFVDPATPPGSPPRQSIEARRWPSSRAARERRAELGALPARIGGADHAEIVRPVVHGDDLLVAQEHGHRVEAV